MTFPINKVMIGFNEFLTAKTFLYPNIFLPKDVP